MFDVIVACVSESSDSKNNLIILISECDYKQKIFFFDCSNYFKTKYSSINKTNIIENNKSNPQKILILSSKLNKHENNFGQDMTVFNQTYF